MNSFETLMSRRWILKSEDAPLYYDIKDHAKEIQKKMQDKFGFTLIINPYLVKLEKIPGKAEGWMGIQEFTSVREYQMFCFLLMFLEDKELEEQFVLSTLTEFIQVQFPDGEIQWTQRRTRHQLVRVLQYAVKCSLMIPYDGEEDYFLKDETSEVLYENTGISKYYMRNFTRDVMAYQKPEDFEQSEWIDMEEDRGIVRRQRIYRRLMLSCGIYKDITKTHDEDLNYIRNYRRNIEADFQSLCSCRLDVHTSSAYVILEEDSNMGTVFPKNHALHDLMLMIHEDIRKRVKQSRLSIDQQELAWLTVEEFDQNAKRLIRKYNQFLPKKYQEISVDALTLAQQLRAMEISYGFAQQQEEQLCLFPIVGKINGTYRED